MTSPKANPTTNLPDLLEPHDQDIAEQVLGEILSKSLGRVFYLANSNIPIVPLRVDFPHVVYLLEERGLVVQRSRISELGISL